jgi:hypothetical protein
MSEDKPVLKDMLGNLISVGDVMALPTSNQGYSQRLILINELPYDEKKKKYKKLKFIKLRKDLMDEVQSGRSYWRELHSAGHTWQDAVLASTLTKYGIVVTKMLTEDQLDAVSLAMVK